MSTEIRAGLLGFLPFHGLFDLSGSFKSLSKSGMCVQPMNDRMDLTVSDSSFLLSDQNVPQYLKIFYLHHSQNGRLRHLNRQEGH